MLRECPLLMKCQPSWPRCQACINKAWITVLNKYPANAAAFDFDRPEGHAEARKKDGWGKAMSLMESMRCQDCNELRALCACPHEDWIDDIEVLWG